MSLYDSSQITQIHPIPVIRYLGFLVGLVAGLPSWGGCLWLLFHPSKVIADPGVLLFVLPIGLITLFATRGWLRLGAQSTEMQIVFKGWWNTISIDPSALAWVRRIYVRGTTGRGNLIHYLEDHRGESLGNIPSILAISRNWDSFLEHLHCVASDSRERRRSASNSETRLSDMSVDEWTPDDIDRYESQS